MERLPQEVRRFAVSFAAARGVGEPLQDDTPGLALLGTRGDLPAWNERRASRGHLAIPLVSPSFVEEIPMVSRMLKDLGFPIDWVTGASKGTTDLFGKLGGFFYVAGWAAPGRAAALGRRQRAAGRRPVRADPARGRGGADWRPIGTVHRSSVGRAGPPLWAFSGACP